MDPDKMKEALQAIEAFTNAIMKGEAGKWPCCGENLVSSGNNDALTMAQIRNAARRALNIPE